MTHKKRCSKCGEKKSLKNFHRKVDSKDGYRSRCKICRAADQRVYYTGNRRSINKRHKQYRKTHTEQAGRRVAKWRGNNRERANEAAKGYNLKHKFGLTKQARADMSTAQQGKCAICGRHESQFKYRLAVDHDHTTDKIRELLCIRCNTMIGMAGDDRDILAEAIKYLEKHGERL
ncbi:endonuclease VII domain-containing protein [Candidatus Pacearchaeota archaeon]|nr:endonuclease VII domain-containing protein [Candidatus Pacearchaeota archaeon]